HEFEVCSCKTTRPVCTVSKFFLLALVIRHFLGSIGTAITLVADPYLSRMITPIKEWNSSSAYSPVETWVKITGISNEGCIGLNSLVTLYFVSRELIRTIE